MTNHGDPDPWDFDQDECMGCIRGEHLHCEACGEPVDELIPVTDVDSIPQTVNCCAKCAEDKP